MAKSRALRAISLYSGAGGLDYGFEAAGFETRVALDIDPIACRFITQNRDWAVLEGDVASHSSRAILRTASLRRGDADILIGGPPCQPFSKSGYWATGDAKRLDDPRAGTLGQYLRVLRDTLPEVFLLENVPGFAFSKKNEGLELIRRGIESINKATGANYSFDAKVLNAADFGVPQNRERVFIVGARGGRLFNFPTPTHGSDEMIRFGFRREKYRTAWDAFKGLPANPKDPTLNLTGKWADLLPTIPEGENYLWHTERGGGQPLFGWRTRYWNFMLKLAKDQPAWTIQAQPGPATGPFHWKNRKLSIAELARLQTFPDDLKFDCNRSDAQRLLGNAVPSALAEILGREIRQQYFGQKLKQPPVLAPSFRSGPPAKEPTKRLPAKYRSLVGEHEAHPGTGKGRGAKARELQAA
jgi:DNA (cytosine-5)-methyltransferase 1